MRGRAVSRVALPAVSGKPFRKIGHQAIARHLGGDGGGGDGQRPAVTADQAIDPAAGRGRQGRRPVAVDQGEIRHPAQGLNRAIHGQEGRLQNVEGIDFRRRGLPDADHRMGGEFRQQAVAGGGFQSL